MRRLSGRAVVVWSTHARVDDIGVVAMTQKKTVLLDVDDVILDCSGAVHKAAQEILGRVLPAPKDWTDFSFAIAMQLSDSENRLLHRVLLAENDLASRLNFMPGAADFVDKLASWHDVVFVTAHWPRMPSWVPTRDAFLGRHFPQVDIVYTHAKQRVLGDFLFDDKPENVRSNAARAWLFTRPWNRTYDFRRVSSYEEIIQVVSQ